MADWKTVATGSGTSEEDFKVTDVELSELSPGTKGRLVVTGIPGWATHAIFDVIGAEQTFGKYLVPEGAKVIDCHEEGGIGYVEFEVTGSPVVPIVIALAKPLFFILIGMAILGIAIVISMQILKTDPKLITWQIVLVIAMIIVAVVVVTVLVARRGKLSAGPVKVGK